MRGLLTSAGIVLGIIPSFAYAAIFTFKTPIDALSIEVSSHTQEINVRGFDGTAWTEWQVLHDESEQDPALTESNLVIFPHAVTQIDISPKILESQLHPIRVSHAPPAWLAAARSGAVTKPRILTRAEWGADESLLFESTNQPPEPPAEEQPAATEHTEETVTVNKRVEDCKAAQETFADEFAVKKTVKEIDGKTLLWPQQYSPHVSLLVVHHTAMEIRNDERPGIERVRALFAYHAVNRGWGDVGYNFLIDEEGQIYEGRRGGPHVVGGHAYCNNIGSIGVALLGNFEVERPTQVQIQSLQWLLRHLADTYRIDSKATITFHGKTLPTIVGHRDLLSTDCPGYYAYGVLAEVRKHVASGDIEAPVRFPQPIKKPKKTPLSSGTSGEPILREGVSALGSTLLHGRPETQLRVMLRYQAGPTVARKRSVIAPVKRSREDIGLWQETGTQSLRVRDGLILPQPVPARGTIMLKLRVQLPKVEGMWSLKIGDVTYVLEVGGRKRGQVPFSRPVKARNTPKKVPVPVPVPIRILITKAGDVCSDERSLLALRQKYRGTLECIDSELVNEVTLEEYLLGLAEEDDSQPPEKQKAFAVAARTYAAYYMDSAHRKFPGKPYDGSDSPAIFQAYGGKAFEQANSQWVRAVEETKGLVLMKGKDVIRAPYFSTDDGRTRSPEEVGWPNFPFAEILQSKPDPWCEGMQLRGHGVGMSGCGAGAQAREGKKYEEILQYYYPSTELRILP